MFADLSIKEHGAQDRVKEVRLADEQGRAVSVQPMTLGQFEAFYTSEYPKLVKTLVLIGATIEEAEDAAQRAMADFAERSRTARAPEHPAAYVRRAAINFFVKERQRDRERLPRELRGGHLVIEAHCDDQLTTGEDEEYVERLLECLTPAQRQVIKLVMDGWSTPEIAKELGKSDANIRQHLKNGRDLLRVRPEIIALAPRSPPDQDPAAHGGVRTTAKTQRRKEAQWTVDPRTT